MEFGGKFGASTTPEVNTKHELLHQQKKGIITETSCGSHRVRWGGATLDDCSVTRLVQKKVAELEGVSFGDEKKKERRLHHRSSTSGLRDSVAEEEKKQERLTRGPPANPPHPPGWTPRSLKTKESKNTRPERPKCQNKQRCQKRRWRRPSGHSNGGGGHMAARGEAER